MLYFIATPIGNLADISKRALSTLELCDLVFCEDTRHSGKLLSHFGIKKKLLSYHKFNEQKILETLISELKQGKNIALISDAGTPAINDPGLVALQACIEHELPFTAIPGPCSPILALILSGMDTSQFQYLGFLPKKPKKSIMQALCYPGTTIALESPQRIVSTLEEIHRIDPERNVAIAREMTKLYEECVRGSVATVLTQLKQKPVRGEMVLLIEGGFSPDLDVPVEEVIQMLQELHGLSLKEALKVAAKLKKVPKRDLYKQLRT